MIRAEHPLLILENAAVDVALHHFGILLEGNVRVKNGVGQLDAGLHAALARLFREHVQPVDTLEEIALREAGLELRVLEAVHVQAIVSAAVFRKIELPLGIVGVVQTGQRAL